MCRMCDNCLLQIMFYQCGNGTEFLMNCLIAKRPHWDITNRFVYCGYFLNDLFAIHFFFNILFFMSNTNFFDERNS